MPTTMTVAVLKALTLRAARPASSAMHARVIARRHQASTRARQHVSTSVGDLQAPGPEGGHLVAVLVLAPGGRLPEANSQRGRVCAVDCGGDAVAGHLVGALPDGRACEEQRDTLT